MKPSYPKIIESPHYHLWTDTLHARALAREAHNKWDRGSYVRWAVITACTVLEIACQNALDEGGISYSFKKNLNAALARRSLPPLGWGGGLWQKVLEIRQLRTNYMHRFVSETDLFPEAVVADYAIDIVRSAVTTIYRHTQRVPPPWIQDDEDRGWDTGRGPSATLTVVRSGVREDDPRAVKIVYTTGDREHLSEVLPPGTDPEPYVQDLLTNVRTPINAIRVYEGNVLLTERIVTMRGS